MKVSLNWLKEMVELPATVAELTELLTLAGVEVEGIETRGVAIDKIVVAQVLESSQHPNADRLSVCKVDDGSGSPLQIVCGAKNYKVGDKVPLAQAGAVLPGDFKIKVGKLRGVESHGMMCSAKELGLAEDADGLLILPEGARVGAPLSELFPGDTILDLEITPNRPDLLSHVGIAREIAALTKKDCRLPIANCELPGAASDGIRIEALDRCPFYSARKVSGVKVGPSPAWLRQKLEAIGIRSINNIVDVTNFVMLETGQPLHAFDADKLHGGIRVRTASENEEFLALDGRTYKLHPQHLAIADAEHAVAIAGVMGGEETGVVESTTNILLESAYFQPVSVRRTAREIGLISDSSYRFERGVDPQNVLAASQRSIDLILEVAGGEAEPAPGIAGEAPDFSRSVILREGRCTEVLGTEIPGTFIAETLTRFGLTASGDRVWRVPSFRQDLTREIDLVEEVTRVFGIDRIPSRETGRFVASTPTDRSHDRDMKLRRTLVARGFHEARTLTLISEKAAADPLFPTPELRRVRNPLNEDQVVLRPSLMQGLLHAVQNNVRGGVKNLALFELGRVFLNDETEEQTHLGLLMTGTVEDPSWRAGEVRDADFFDLKGVLAALKLGDLEFTQTQNPALALALDVKWNGEVVGHAGQLWPAHARKLDLHTAVLVAEIDLSAFPAEAVARNKFIEIDKYPAVARDIAMIVPAEVQHGQVADLLRKANEPLLVNVELFDVFTDPTGKKVASDQKSVAYSLTYRAKDRTLTAEEVNAAHARLKERLKTELNVSFRE